MVLSSIRSFQVQLSDSFKRCQSMIRNDIKELGHSIQVLSDRQFTHGIAVGTTLSSPPYHLTQNGSFFHFYILDRRPVLSSLQSSSSMKNGENDRFGTITPVPMRLTDNEYNSSPL